MHGYEMGGRRMVRIDAKCIQSPINTRTQSRQFINQCLTKSALHSVILTKNIREAVC